MTIVLNEKVRKRMPHPPPARDAHHQSRRRSFIAIHLSHTHVGCLLVIFLFSFSIVPTVSGPQIWRCATHGCAATGVHRHRAGESIRQDER